jgi:hypothetical protein
MREKQLLRQISFSAIILTPSNALLQFSGGKQTGISELSCAK